MHDYPSYVWFRFSHSASDESSYSRPVIIVRYMFHVCASSFMEVIYLSNWKDKFIIVNTYFRLNTIPVQEQGYDIVVSGFNSR